MILIIAGLGLDAEAARPAGWSAEDCPIVRAADLSTSGWSHGLPSGSVPATIAIDRNIFPETAITGVLTRTTWIGAHELPHIVAADRDYVASEMSAFLLSWLHALVCPVVNRPMPGCLSGPGWRPRQWAAAAAAVGLSIAHAPAESTVSEATASVVTVVGTRCFGEADPALRAGSLALARLAKVDLLEVHFAGEAFIGANPFPDLFDRSVADALRDVFDRPATRPVSFPVLRPWRAAQAALASRRATASPIG